MAIATHQVERILSIWNEHMEVAKALPGLASAVSSAVDRMASSLAVGGQLLIAGNGDQQPTRSTSLPSLRDVSCVSGSRCGPLLCTGIRQLSRRLGTITVMIECLPGNLPPMPGRVTYSWLFRPAAIVRIFCAQLRRLANARFSSSA